MNVVETLADYAASQIAIMVDNGWLEIDAELATEDYLHDLVGEAMDEAQARRKRHD